MYFHNSLPTAAVYVLLLAFLFAYLYFTKNSIVFSVKKNMSVLNLGGLFFLLVLGGSTFLRIFFLVQSENFSLSEIANLVVVYQALILRAVFLTVFTLLCFGMGKKILAYSRFRFENFGEESVFCFGMGAFFWTLVMFFIGLLHMFYFWPLLILVLFAFYFFRVEILYFLKKMNDTKIRISFSSRVFQAGRENAFSFMLFLVFLLMAMYFISSFYTIPTDYDDLDTYFSVPLLFSEYHGIVPFHNSISASIGGIGTSLYAAVNGLLSPEYNFSFSWLYLFFLLASIFLFAKKYFSYSIASVAVFLSAMVPWNSYFVTTQKVIFLFALLSVLSIYAFCNWGALGDKKWLYLSALFLGAMVTIKLNGLFLFFSIGVALCVLFVAKRATLRNVFIFFSIAVTAMLPVFVYNAAHYQNPLSFFVFSNKSNERFFHDGAEVSTMELTQKGMAGTTDFTQLIRRTKISDNFVINFFWMIWNTTINQRGFNYLYSEIGPFILIFFPFFLFYLVLGKKYNDKTTKLLLLIAVPFFVLWHLRGYARPWYGISYFYILFIFCARVFFDIRSRGVRGLFAFFMIVFLVKTFFFSFSAIAQFPHILLTPEQNSVFQEFAATKTPLFAFYGYLNSNVLEKQEGAKILLIPESRTAFLKRWDKTIIADHWGLYWEVVWETAGSYERAKEILIQQGITHVAYSLDFEKWILLFAKSGNDEFPITDNLEKLRYFCENYLEKVYCEEESYCLYEVN